MSTPIVLPKSNTRKAGPVEIGTKVRIVSFKRTSAYAGRRGVVVGHVNGGSTPIIELASGLTVTGKDEFWTKV